MELGSFWWLVALRAAVGAPLVWWRLGEGEGVVGLELHGLWRVMEVFGSFGPERVCRCLWWTVWAVGCLGVK